MREDRQCTAKTRTGQRCRSAAILGATTCRMHGGSAPQVKAAAARRRQQEAAARAVALFGAPRDVDPAQALLDLVHWTAGEVEYWREQVRALAVEDPSSLTWGITREKSGGDDYGTTAEAKPNVAYVMLYAAQDRLAQYATAALKAGVAERQVRLAETQGALVAGAVRAILEALGLSAEQWALVPQVVPEQLRLLAGGEGQ
ncbi:HGGxSTG domain-containing protein [Pseudactinotalea sp. Z1732]|uniref:HGGxSTG domain-containing protein n=1 Tax=Micrococcales TaxID=85006 RepID=UPI003C79EF77